MTALDEKITGAVMVPLSGLLAVLFVGWRMNGDILNIELQGTSAGARKLLLFLVRIVAPVFVAVVLVAQILASY